MSLLIIKTGIRFVTKFVQSFLDQVEIHWQKEDCRECLNIFCTFREDFELYWECQKRQRGVSVA
jgi:hypothetical protein